MTACDGGTVADDPQLEDVREWYITGRRVHDPFNSDANLVERFDLWLAERDREIAEKAWRDGYYTGKRDYAGSITGGVSISTANPHGPLSVSAGGDS